MACELTVYCLVVVAGDAQVGFEINTLLVAEVHHICEQVLHVIFVMMNPAGQHVLRW